MKRRKLAPALLCLLLCCGLALSACTSEAVSAPPPATDAPVETSAPSGPAETYTVDFSDGKTGFLMLNTGSPDTDRDSSMEIAGLDGANALKLTAPNGGALRLGINADGLLGSRVTEVRTAVFDVYAEYPDGNFHAVKGSVTAYRGDLSESSAHVWTVYLASRNPNAATAMLAPGQEFVSGGPNIFEFSCTANGPFDNGETPAAIYIQSITFYDAANVAIPVNTGAGWAGPEGYGDAPPSIIARPDPGVFTNENDGKYRFPIAHLIGPFATVTVVYTPAEGSGDLEFIVKDPENGYWAQNGADEIIEDGAQRRAVISAASIEKKFPGAIGRASETTERGVVITNWNDGTVIDEIIIENATALPVSAADFADESGGKYRYAMAGLIAPYSTIQILYTPASYEGGDNLEMIVKNPEKGYWHQLGADSIEEFGNKKQYVATFKADSYEQEFPGTFARAAETDEQGIVITNWSDETVIDEILIFDPLPE